MEAVMRLICIC